MTITRDTERPTRGGEDAAAAGGSSAGLPWHTIVPFYSLLARRTTTAVPDAPENPESAARRRPPPRRSKWLDRWGWYEHRAAGAYTTTRQAEVLNLATQRRDARSEGVLFGLNKLSQSLVIIDPFALYGDEIENINVCAIGDIGKGKSSGIKTGFVLRQIAAGRRVVVLDKKRQGASGGEYTPIARELGAASVRFRTGGEGVAEPARSGDRRDRADRRRSRPGRTERPGRRGVGGHDGPDFVRARVRGAQPGPARGHRPGRRGRGRGDRRGPGRRDVVPVDAHCRRRRGR
ncbi:hypothetical protein [Tomitella cavernea]|uniref:Uncharacterized protein n=1 Tax=Tomitella cavernea TaxID=1387982 RepID=A0ABP9D2X4_9ACTN